MKKNSLILLVLTTVSVVLGGCAKNLSAPVTKEREIRFLAAKYVTKADDAASAFSGSSFGVYSWNNNGSEGYYMENALVTKQKKTDSGTYAWMAVGTYYWPSRGKLDFICYYPREEQGGYVKITPDKISYSNFDVKANQIDLLYADKAVGYSYEDSESGVPALFNHALSRVCIKAAKSYGSKTTEEADNSLVTTRWDVRINSASFIGAASNGSADFALAGTKAFGTLGWDKPTQTREKDGAQIAFNVWTPGKQTFNQKLDMPEGGLHLDVLSRDSKGVVIGGFKDVLPFTFVIPQMLNAGKQTLWLNYSIDTYQTVNGKESLFNTETYNKTVDLLIPDELEAWQINQSITYYIMIAPTRGLGNGGKGTGDPLDPNYPVDPDNPDLSDAFITFSPIVDGWSGTNISAVMNL